MYLHTSTISIKNNLKNPAYKNMYTKPEIGLNFNNSIKIKLSLLWNIFNFKKFAKISGKINIKYSNKLKNAIKILSQLISLIKSC